MNQLIVAVLCVFSAAAGAWIAWTLTHKPIGTVLGDRVHRRVVVTLKSQLSYAAVLAEADSHAFVLQSTELLKPDGTRVAVDGELVILRGDVAYLQLP